MNMLVVVDMQNDFIDGALGTKEAAAIVPAVEARIRAYEKAGDPVWFTFDTHGEDYLRTQEGKNLPIPHCVKGTRGWALSPALTRPESARYFYKDTFGCAELAQALRERNAQTPLDGVEFAGLCTDICVISNALLVKAFLPEIPLYVHAACCAGVTPGSHQAALSAMSACQVHILPASAPERTPPLPGL